ncbi:MAG: hypothetical protein ACR5KW_03070 [Wolbachia sp.]
MFTDITSSYEKFKLINDRKLKKIESKGQTSSTTITQLRKIDSNIDNYKKKRLDLIKTTA